MKQTHGPRTWIVLGLLEAGAASLLATSLTAGPFPSKDLRPMLWLALSCLLFAVYLAPVLVITAPILRTSSNGHRAAWLSTAPFAVVFAAGLGTIQVNPALADRLWTATSPIQPFPLLAVCTGLLGALLLKLALVAKWLGPGDARRRITSSVGTWTVPVALLALGAYQATMYILPIGNATLRFWAIADGMFEGTGYPLTLTEPGPVSAGSPPYVYDLPLFPLLIRAAFGILGHNSAAVHIPGIISSALFPLALYLLTKEVTRSRVTAVVFTALASLFPFLRFWVLNLPDPDPFFLTSLCFAAYFYVRALAARESTGAWIAAGIASGVTSLARPEGLLYAGFLGLGILACRPRLKQLVLYGITLGAFLVPMAVVWMANFGFLWPQNYNRTLDLNHPAATYQLMDKIGDLPRLYQGLALSAESAIALGLIFLLSAVFGIAAMSLKNRFLLAIAVPALGNTLVISFTNPWISNAFHYADFFRHASFGIPFLVVASAYGFQSLANRLEANARLRIVPLACLLLLVVVTVREGDIDANPTLTHRYGSPIATQVLTSNPHLSLQTILDHPMPLPPMSYERRANNVLVAYPSGLRWPEAALEFFGPLDLSFDSRGIAFGYGSVVAFLLALAFAALAEGRLLKGASSEKPEGLNSGDPQALPDSASAHERWAVQGK